MACKDQHHLATAYTVFKQAEFSPVSGLLYLLVLLPQIFTFLDLSLHVGFSLNFTSGAKPS